MTDLPGRFHPPLTIPEAGYYTLTLGGGVLAVHGPQREPDDRGDLLGTYHYGPDGWSFVIDVPEHPGDPAE